MGDTMAPAYHGGAVAAPPPPPWRGMGRPPRGVSTRGWNSDGVRSPPPPRFDGKAFIHELAEDLEPSHAAAALHPALTAYNPRTGRVEQLDLDLDAGSIVNGAGHAIGDGITALSHVHVTPSGTADFVTHSPIDLLAMIFFALLLLFLSLSFCVEEFIARCA